MSFTAASLRLFAGVIVWALHFTVIYGYTAVACARGLPASVPWAIGAATAAATVACFWLLHREIRRRQEFTSWVAAGLSSFALVAIVWETLPVFTVPPCS